MSEANPSQAEGAPSPLIMLQACVKRRAVLSVIANPSCESQEMAEKVVNEVWESCSNDTRPFDEVSCGRRGGRASGPLTDATIQIY